ncbi:hypothetical protein NC653_004102 [Populus alba x Populus x berolinensis]|uniref:Uncharacterized protein n=1 Tax=Populus alba x Populus x berolinensis TaxID=444605 RepID=A0AAD6WJ65_9ROSI|nr:hypothetical protein NC653_004102 [Populus alba x Populus x berolinensis]
MEKASLKLLFVFVLVFQKELKRLGIVQVTLIVPPVAQQAAQMLIVST